MTSQSEARKRTVARVMHAYKHGTLDRRDGEPVETPEQAIAITLHEAGASRDTRSDRKANKRRQSTSRKRQAATARAWRPQGSKAELYAEAWRREPPGRSWMSKDELAKALAQ